MYRDEDRIAADLFVKTEHGPDAKADEWDLDSLADPVDILKEFPDLGVLYADGFFYDGVEWQPHVARQCWWMERVGKHRAGRLLDGIEHNAMPKGSAEWLEGLRVSQMPRARA